MDESPFIYLNGTHANRGGSNTLNTEKKLENIKKCKLIECYHVKCCGSIFSVRNFMQSDKRYYLLHDSLLNWWYFQNYVTACQNYIKFSSYFFNLKCVTILIYQTILMCCLKIKKKKVSINRMKFVPFVARYQPLQMSTIEFLLLFFVTDF